MGLKFTDILIRDHKHDLIMEYFHKGRFMEFGKTCRDFTWKIRKHPILEKLGVKHEICTWKADGNAFENSMEIKSNKNVKSQNIVPWIRITLRHSDILDSSLAKSLSQLSPGALIGCFDYLSFDDSAYIGLYKGEGEASLWWYGEANKVDVISDRTDELVSVFTLPRNLQGMAFGEEILAYYWGSLFSCIPIRDLKDPSKELISFLKKIDFNAP